MAIINRATDFTSVSLDSPTLTTAKIPVALKYKVNQDDVARYVAYIENHDANGTLGIIKPVTIAWYQLTMGYVIDGHVAFEAYRVLRSKATFKVPVIEYLLADKPALDTVIQDIRDLDGLARVEPQLDLTDEIRTEWIKSHFKGRAFITDKSSTNRPNISLPQLINVWRQSPWWTEITSQDSIKDIYEYFNDWTRDHLKVDWCQEIDVVARRIGLSVRTLETVMEADHYLSFVKSLHTSPLFNSPFDPVNLVAEYRSKYLEEEEEEKVEEIVDSQATVDDTLDAV